MTFRLHRRNFQPALFVGAVCGLLIPVLLAPASPSAASASQIGGKYCGTAWSDGQLVEVETSFQTGSDGLLVGSYIFADHGEGTPGTLREYVKQLDDTRILIWVDKYGTGQLVIRFDDSRSSFDGNWGVYVETPTHRWGGRRCETPVA